MDATARGLGVLPPERRGRERDGGRGVRSRLRRERRSEAERGAFYTLVPIRPRWRGERRFLRTFAGVSLRPPLGFNPRHRRLSTPSDAFQLHPDIDAGSRRGARLARPREGPARGVGRVTS